MSSNPVLDILRGARIILADEESWTQGKYAKDENGIAVTWREGDASCFCLDGAVLASAEAQGFMNGPRAHLDKARIILCSLVPTVDGNPVAEFNDAWDRKHSQVLAVLDDAIEIAAGKRT